MSKKFGINLRINSNGLLLASRIVKYLRKIPLAGGKFRYIYKQDFNNPLKLLFDLFSFDKAKVSTNYKSLQVNEKYGISEHTFAQHLLEYMTNRSKWDNLFKTEKLQKEQTKSISQLGSKRVQTFVPNTERKMKNALIFNKNIMRDLFNLFNKGAMHGKSETPERITEESIIVSRGNDRKDVGRETIKTARENLTKKPTHDFLSENLRRTLRPHQKDFINLAIEAFDSNEKAVFNMDGTGAGKTLQELGLAQTYFDKNPTKPILIVTPNKRIIDNAFVPDAALAGMSIKPVQDKADIEEPGIYITTYNRLKEFTDQNFGITIFDESHSLKNKSQQTSNGEKIIENSDRIGLFSATPLDKGNQIGYITKAFGLRKTQLMQDLGYELKSQRIGRGRTTMVWAASESAEEIANRIDALFSSLTEAGVAIKREVPLDNLETKISKIELTEEQKQKYNQAEENFYQAIERNPKSKAVNLMTLRRLTEELKIDHTVANIIKDLESNKKKQIVLFATRVNDSSVFDADSLGTLREISRRLKEIGLDHVNVFDSSKQAANDIESFQNGNVRVLLTTPESGGTGLSLDDTKGDAPRKAIVVTPPFSAMDFIQIAGRINRLNTKSKAEVEMLSTDTMIDGWNKDIIANKLLTLGSAVSGDYKKLDIKELDKLQYMSAEDQREYMQSRNIADQKIPYKEDRKINYTDYKFDKEVAISSSTIRFPKYPLRNISSYETFIPKDVSSNWPNANISFGKYRGLTLSQLQNKDPGYMTWLLGNIGSKYANAVGSINFIDQASVSKSKKFDVKIVYKDGKILLKGKRAAEGEVRTRKNGQRYKKVGNKWVPVPSQEQPKKSPEETGKKPEPEPTDKGKNKKSALMGHLKEAMKDAIKGIANVFADVYAGKGGSEAAVQETQIQAEHANRIGEESKKQKEEFKGKETK